MTTAIAKGRSAEAKVVTLLNGWADGKVFRRAGLGQKGQDIICSWPKWKYQIEVKLQDIHPISILNIFERECKKKGYDPQRLWFFYRCNSRIWVALSTSAVSELESYWGKTLFAGDVPCIYLPYSLYIFGAGALLKKLIDPDKVYGKEES